MIVHDLRRSFFTGMQLSVDLLAQAIKKTRYCGKSKSICDEPQIVRPAWYTLGQ
jgi:hypothetical protein